jgi:hypothetical protein
LEAKEECKCSSNSHRMLDLFELKIAGWREKSLAK